MSWEKWNDRKVYELLFDLRSCDSSIWGGDSILHSVRHSNDGGSVEWNYVGGSLFSLYFLRWLHELYGPLQLRVRPYLSLHSLSSSQVSHLYSIVSLSLHLKFKGKKKLIWKSWESSCGCPMRLVDDWLGFQKKKILQTIY